MAGQSEDTGDAITCRQAEGARLRSGWRMTLGSRYPRSLRRRLLLLLLGNLLLAGLMSARLSQEGAGGISALMSGFAPNAAPRILAGIGLTGIILCGAIDLSIGSIIVMAGTVFGIGYEWGQPPWLCFTACFITAWGLSAFNGLVVRWLGLPAIIVTLAGLTFYRGLALLLADQAIEHFSGQIGVRIEAYHTPGKHWAGVLLSAGVLAGLVWELCGRRPRQWLAVGNSPEACRLSGLRPERILHSAFLSGGLFLGLAAIVDVTNRLTIEPARLARGFELEVIGGTVLGGTNIFGGEGSVAGTVLGVLFLYLVGQSLVLAGVSEYWRTALQGAVILGVIGIDCSTHRRRKLLDELR
ncbi:MAG: ABC transporter permease [Planctomycetaceae bacterium]|nr:ABC transporter permease [Planctomycetaceae bacterium]